MSFGIAEVAVITVICYLVAEAVKCTALNNKQLPTICGAVGEKNSEIWLQTDTLQEIFGLLCPVEENAERRILYEAYQALGRCSIG